MEKYKGGDRLVKCMKKLGETPQNEVPTLVVGKVTDGKPLKVQIGDKIVLSKSFLVLSPFVNPKYKTDLAEEAGVLCKESLQKGDKVLMLRINKGQTFYVLQKIQDDA